jgi:hypothetical protein
VNQSVEEHSGCALRDKEFGRGQNPSWAGTTHFLPQLRGQSDPWGRSSPVFCPRMSLQTIARSQETGCYRVKTVSNAFCTFGPRRVLTTLGSYSHARVYFARHEAAALLARTVSVPVKWASPPNFTPRNFTDHFILRRAQHKENHSDQRSRRTKLHGAQNLPEAGATPPFDAPCVAAHSGSLPPQPTGIAARRGPRERALSNRSYAAAHAACPTRLHDERRRVLATLKGTT